MTRYGRDFSKLTRTKTWGEPLKWQKAAAAAGRTERVFTCSWSDFFHEDADRWRAEAWEVIRQCPNLQFQILTKRPERILEEKRVYRGDKLSGFLDWESLLPLDWGDGWPNVWLGVSVENPKYLWRVDELRKVPARIRFISAEPLLAPLPTLDLAGISWVIVGGESGPGYRPMKTEWARELLAKCRTAGVPFFHKQASALRTETGIELDGKIYHEFPDVSAEAGR